MMIINTDTPDNTIDHGNNKKRRLLTVLTNQTNGSDNSRSEITFLTSVSLHFLNLGKMICFSTCSSGTWKCEVEDMCDRGCPSGLVFKKDVPPCIPTCDTHFADIPVECPYGLCSTHK